MALKIQKIERRAAPRARIQTSNARREIDVGSKEDLYRLMEQLARDGVAILFASSEMEEILGMSDRTLVMYEGGIAGELGRDELNEEAIMQLATGNVQAA